MRTKSLKGEGGPGAGTGQHILKEPTRMATVPNRAPGKMGELFLEDADKMAKTINLSTCGDWCWWRGHHPTLEKRRDHPFMAKIKPKLNLGQTMVSLCGHTHSTRVRSPL